MVSGIVYFRSGRVYRCFLLSCICQPVWQLEYTLWNRFSWMCVACPVAIFLVYCTWICVWPHDWRNVCLTRGCLKHCIGYEDVAQWHHDRPALASATFTFVLYHGESWILVLYLFVAGQRWRLFLLVMSSGNAHFDVFVDSVFVWNGWLFWHESFMRWYRMPKNKGVPRIIRWYQN